MLPRGTLRRRNLIEHVVYFVYLCVETPPSSRRSDSSAESYALSSSAFARSGTGGSTAGRGLVGGCARRLVACDRVRGFVADGRSGDIDGGWSESLHLGAQMDHPHGEMIQQGRHFHRIRGNVFKEVPPATVRPERSGAVCSGGEGRWGREGPGWSASNSSAIWA